MRLTAAAATFGPMGMAQGSAGGNGPGARTLHRPRPMLRLGSMGSVSVTLKVAACERVHASVLRRKSGCGAPFLVVKRRRCCWRIWLICVSLPSRLQFYDCTFQIRIQVASAAVVLSASMNSFVRKGSV